MNISFIGYGNMAKAIARSLQNQGKYSLSAAAPSLTAGINKENIRTHHDNKEIVKNADIIILAVKPSQMSPVLKEINPFIPINCLLISVAAGLTLTWFAKQCNKGQAVIRTMPNTPATVGMAATPMIANEFTNQKQKKWAEQLFSSIGITSWVENEEDMDTFTALSGSGPAYVFLFIETMINAAVELGLNERVAKIFAMQTFLGALHLAQHSKLDLAELRTKVTSPGGTTAAALQILHKQLDDLIYSAMKAAKERAHELGNIN
ncbi:pyrroline-5-carboxylate reductase [Legionella norrlandica]|uniref:Pyrroline-5-carboxylate reductase n=1 Tax=Legionella norrlandica TaxID=1498499 RepID=A0A0A2SUL7_9GAMM|nr:pyrroline-5-carboxylate reductase [Legionella norrlandica]KGP63386.1 pyrroline-5-carboxylate reductase [Legionella norrlandica]